MSFWTRRTPTPVSHQGAEAIQARRFCHRQGRETGSKQSCAGTEARREAAKAGRYTLRRRRVATTPGRDGDREARRSALTGGTRSPGRRASALPAAIAARPRRPIQERTRRGPRNRECRGARILGRVGGSARRSRRRRLSPSSWAVAALTPEAALSLSVLRGAVRSADEPAGPCCVGRRSAGAGRVSERRSRGRLALPGAAPTRCWSRGRRAAARWRLLGGGLRRGSGRGRGNRSGCRSRRGGRRLQRGSPLSPSPAHHLAHDRHLSDCHAPGSASKHQVSS